MAQASTGKADSGVAGAAVSNIAEKVAVDQTAQQQADVQQQANVAEQAQQNEEEQQYLQLQDQELEYRSRGLAVKQEFNSQISKLVQDFQQKGDTLDLEKSKAAAEQIGTLMRLQDDKYTNNLKLEGAKKRLDNSVKFKEAALEAAFGNQLTLLQDDFDAKSLLRAEGREFAIKLEQLGLQQALALVDSEIQGDKDAMLWRGIGSAANAGITAWGMSDSTKTASTSTSKVGATDIPGSPGYLENLTSTNSVTAPAPDNFVLQSSQNKKG